MDPGSLNGWTIVRFLHVTAAALWVGGQLLLTLVVAPLARRHLAPDTRAVIVGGVGRRFGTLTTAVLLPVLVATGIALAWHRGVTLDSFRYPGYGRTLGLKIVLVVVMVGAAAAHGIAAGRGRTRLARSLGLGSLGLSLVVVLLATALVP